MLIDVEAGGEIYNGMHVDGGTTAQVFFYPPDIDWRHVTEAPRVRGKPTLYVIRNASLTPAWAPVERKFADIAVRSIDSLTRTQRIGDLHTLYLMSLRDGLDYRLASITEDFDREPEELFDTGYMRTLFDLGYEVGRQGTAWVDAPLSFDEIVPVE